MGWSPWSRLDLGFNVGVSNPDRKRKNSRGSKLLFNSKISIQKKKVKLKIEKYKGTKQHAGSDLILLCGRIDVLPSLRTRWRTNGYSFRVGRHEASVLSLCGLCVEYSSAGTGAWELRSSTYST